MSKHLTAFSLKNRCPNIQLLGYLAGMNLTLNPFVSQALSTHRSVSTTRIGPSRQYIHVVPNIIEKRPETKVRTLCPQSQEILEMDLVDPKDAVDTSKCSKSLPCIRQPSGIFKKNHDKMYQENLRKTSMDPKRMSREWKKSWILDEEPNGKLTESAVYSVSIPGFTEKKNVVFV
jgi:hypothetical protein